MPKEINPLLFVQIEMLVSRRFEDSRRERYVYKFVRLVAQPVFISQVLSAYVDVVMSMKKQFVNLSLSLVLDYLTPVLYSYRVR